MKFRKRMKPIIKEIDGLKFEAVDWYHSIKSAFTKADQYSNQGFDVRVQLEEWWKGWFVYIRSI